MNKMPARVRKTECKDYAQFCFLWDSHLQRFETRKERIIRKLRAAKERYTKRQSIIAALEAIRRDNERMYRGIKEKN